MSVENIQLASESLLAMFNRCLCKGCIRTTHSAKWVVVAVPSTITPAFHAYAVALPALDGKTQAMAFSLELANQYTSQLESAHLGGNSLVMRWREQLTLAGQPTWCVLQLQVLLLSPTQEQLLNLIERNIQLDISQQPPDPHADQPAVPDEWVDDDDAGGGAPAELEPARGFVLTRPPIPSTIGTLQSLWGMSFVSSSSGEFRPRRFTRPEVSRLVIFLLTAAGKRATPASIEKWTEEELLAAADWAWRKMQATVSGLQKTIPPIPPRVRPLPAIR